MSTTIQPIIATADLDRLLGFYTDVLGAVESTRVPEDGPTFFVGLTVGEADLGLVVNAEVDTGAAADRAQRRRRQRRRPAAAGGTRRRPGTRSAERHALGPAGRAHPGPGRQPAQPHAADVTLALSLIVPRLREWLT